MPEETTTLNAAAESTPESLPGDQVGDVKSDASSTSEQDVKPETLASVLEKRAAEIEEPSKEEPTEEKAEAVEATDEGEEKAEEKPAEKEEPSGTDEKLPFGKHPRWKEVMSELKSLRPLKEEVERLKPIEESVKQVDNFRKQYGVTDDQYKAALEMAALFNVDPKGARAKLQELADFIDSQTGDRLPNDLAKKVEDGIMDVDSAKELARLRVEAQRGKNQVAQTVQDQQRQTQLAMQVELAKWEKAKKAGDPDFNQKKLDLVRAEFAWLVNQQPPQTPSAAVELAEKAYTNVTEVLREMLPKPKVTKRVVKTSGSSTTNAQPVYKNLQERLEARLRELNVSAVQ